MSGFTCRKCGVFVWKGGYDPLRLCEVCSSSAKKCSRCGSADLRGDAPPPDDWRPIETAPRDGSEILVWAPGRDGLQPMFAVTAWHESGGFCVCEVRTPTHWKPLTPPEEPR